MRHFVSICADDAKMQVAEERYINGFGFLGRNATDKLVMRFATPSKSSFVNQAANGTIRDPHHRELAAFDTASKFGDSLKVAYADKGWNKLLLNGYNRQGEYLYRFQERTVGDFVTMLKYVAENGKPFYYDSIQPTNEFKKVPAVIDHVRK